MENIPAIDNREEDMFDLHAFGERDISARCDMGAVRVIDREIPGLAQSFEPILDVPLDHFCRKIMVSLINQIGNREPLPGRSAGVRARAIVILFFRESSRA